MYSVDQLTATVAHTLLRAADQPQFDPNTVTPGFVGFIATFGVAVLVILLVIDMVRRVRRVNYREQVRQQLEQEARDADGPVDGA
ncbi:hypothetical protein ITJ38_09330 [Agreia pratensis]|uniref:Uncharacterized protein n=1 Tax=Agreia pratensis TaxID=150121 RepID=A0A1X7KM22_9MICO|nr:hypothetical protein [Agreia pratensis]MBF4634601.1 hypothetical protein [Agreia pratensis]SMG41763.1 hypothetical protein SAMN06296010_2651 [Agreia pratensis]